jgi:hypothetical protein
MDGATLQDRIYAGYDKAASRIGLAYDIYRPASAVDPLDPSNMVATTFAQFTPGKTGANFNASSDQKSALWSGMFDGRLTQQGDYLVRGTSIFFVAAMQLQLPILCVECAHTVSIVRSDMQTGVGAQTTYGADSSDTDTILGNAIPAAFLFRREGQHSTVGLPADGSRPTFDVMMPKLAFPGGAIITDRDYVVDENGRRYFVVADYLDDQGYFLRVERMEA